MPEFSKLISLFILIAMLTNCSQVLQTVDLEIKTEDNSVQEEFNVIEKTLTIKEAKKQNDTPYERKVLQNARGGNARSILEKFVLVSKFPANSGPIDYKIGIGDVLTYSKFIDNNQSFSNHKKKWPTQRSPAKYKLGVGDTLTLILIKAEKIIQQRPASAGESDQNPVINSQQQDFTINSTGRIGSDGSVLLLEIGRLEANGKTLSELRSEVRNILIRNGTSPRFQLEISDFRSQKAYLTISSSQGTASDIISLNDQSTTLLDMLTAARIAFAPGILTTVKLRRNNDIFDMSLRDIFTTGSPQIQILDRDHIFVEESSARVVKNHSKVDKSGSVVFAGIGKITAAGRSLNELHNEIEKLSGKVVGSNNAFQIEITQFLSQTALLITNNGNGNSRIQITDTPVTLIEMLTNNGILVDANNIVRLNLQRNGASYVFTLDDLLEPNNPSLYLQPGDYISIESFPYKENKVFILGAVNPHIFKINPANRETLADVLFTNNGVLSSSSAKRSEVYLLRGYSPVMAYHLDAQNPTRLIVADTMELRPNDILYVAEQPIISFNRTLGTIVPLRLLLRDIQNGNIP